MSEDDLFRQALSEMGDVKPLPAKPPVREKPPSPPNEAQLRARSAALGEKKPEPPGYLALSDVPMVAPRDTLSWRREGVQELVVDRMRRGQYTIMDSLDLHGEKVKRAREMVHDFLMECHAKGHRCVRIVHGRGEQSPVPARLKSFVNAWLQVHPLVNAFVSATPPHGGTGAVFVLMKKSKDAKDLNRERHGGKPGDTLEDSGL